MVHIPGDNPQFNVYVCARPPLRGSVSKKIVDTYYDIPLTHKTSKKAQLMRNKLSDISEKYCIRATEQHEKSLTKGDLFCTTTVRDNQQFFSIHKIDDHRLRQVPLMKPSSYDESRELPCDGVFFPHTPSTLKETSCVKELVSSCKINEKVSFFLHGNNVFFGHIGPTGGGKTTTAGFKKGVDFTGEKEITDPKIAISNDGVFPSFMRSLFCACDEWEFDIEDLDLQISIGQMIPNSTGSFLSDMIGSDRKRTRFSWDKRAPLLYPHHVTEKLSFHPISKRTAQTIIDGPISQRLSNSTFWNSESSRSHFVITLRCHHEKQKEIPDSYATFIDFAGAENIKGLMGHQELTKIDLSALKGSLNSFDHFLGYIADYVKENHKTGKDFEPLKLTKEMYCRLIEKYPNHAGPSNGLALFCLPFMFHSICHWCVSIPGEHSCGCVCPKAISSAIFSPPSDYVEPALMNVTHLCDIADGHCEMDMPVVVRSSTISQSRAPPLFATSASLKESLKIRTEKQFLDSLVSQCKELAPSMMSEERVKEYSEEIPNDSIESIANYMCSVAVAMYRQAEETSRSRRDVDILNENIIKKVELMRSNISLAYPELRIREDIEDEWKKHNERVKKERKTGLEPILDEFAECILALIKDFRTSVDFHKSTLSGFSRIDPEVKSMESLQQYITKKKNALKRAQVELSNLNLKIIKSDRSEEIKAKEEIITDLERQRVAADKKAKAVEREMNDLKDELERITKEYKCDIEKLKQEASDAMKDDHDKIKERSVQLEKELEAAKRSLLDYKTKCELSEQKCKKLTRDNEEKHQKSLSGDALIRSLQEDLQKAKMNIIDLESRLSERDAYLKQLSEQFEGRKDAASHGSPKKDITPSLTSEPEKEEEKEGKEEGEEDKKTKKTSSSTKGTLKTSSAIELLEQTLQTMSQLKKAPSKKRLKRL
ncbi:hypothetical protein ADUPG1_006225 [Aduncisulcus paluster]|uniref:Kinesin motor domain-containing protein n=1 Tax=Aduncisulcus paluster TaxID=2918883 RepID=A0ABQ5KHD3_9EUKA|nr:hypothetical protein ADUPG1_006225 [Aduncisulcus paluster]